MAGQRHPGHDPRPAGRLRGQPGRVDGSSRRRCGVRGPGRRPRRGVPPAGTGPRGRPRAPGRRPRGRDRLDRDHGGTGRRAHHVHRPGREPAATPLRRAGRPARRRRGAAPYRVHVLRAAAARGGALAARPGPGPGACRHPRPGFGRLPGPAGADGVPALDRRRRGLLPQPRRGRRAHRRSGSGLDGGPPDQVLRRRGGETRRCGLRAGHPRPGPGPDRRASGASDGHHRRRRRLLRRLPEQVAGRRPPPAPPRTWWARRSSPCGSPPRS